MNYKRLLKQKIKLSAGAVVEDKFDPRNLMDVELGVGPADWSAPYTVPDEGKLIVKDQKQTMACTAFAVSYILELLNSRNGNLYRQFSPQFIYSNTFIAPGGGSSLGSAVAPFVCGKGCATLADCPTDTSSEANIRLAINQDLYLKETAKLLAPDNYIFIGNDIDSIASAIQRYGGVAAGFYLDDGWASFSVPASGIIPAPTSKKYAHAVFLTGYLTIGGKKYIRHIGSWGTAWGQKGFGYIPEDYFLNGYLIGAISFGSVPKDFLAQSQDYHYQWNIDLAVGMNTPDVKALQDVLKIEGVMAQSVPSTGYYGNLTYNGVKALQLKYAAQILTPANLTNPTGNCGPSTRAFLNQKYK
ncbi:hypothetical protein M1295_01530 [Patescibacteria group bacterium]|nr:hypothetical protein [Patescibacteria group bacterium]